MTASEWSRQLPSSDRNPFGGELPPWLIPSTGEGVSDVRVALWLQAGDYFDTAQHWKKSAQFWKRIYTIANVVLIGFAALAASAAGVTQLMSGTGAAKTTTAILAIGGGAAAAIAAASNPGRRVQQLDSKWYLYDRICRDIRCFAEIDLQTIPPADAQVELAALSAQLEAIGRETRVTGPTAELHYHSTGPGGSR